MMLKVLAVSCVLGLLATSSTATYAQRSDGRPAGTHNQPLPLDEDGRTTSLDFSPALVGTWKSAPDEMKLTSDFDKSVWGANATSVRTLELTVRPGGEGTLRLTKKVVDGKGRVVPASTWVEEAHLKVGGATPGVATRVEHHAAVVKAVRLFPDDPGYRWPLDGLRVKLVTFQDGGGDSIEIRYDTPEGRGSFWETLRRQRRTPERATR
jgi:hypothetical protein